MGNDDYIQELKNSMLDFLKEWEEQRGIVRENRYSVFEKDIELISEIVKQYADQYDALKKITDETTARIEYCIGAEVHRGFYCPSLVEDIVIGNVKRGRIAKRTPKKPSYTYCFDKNNYLISVISEFNREFIIRDGEREIGITYFDDFKCIGDVVSVCEYRQGRLSRYLLAGVRSSDVWSIRKEEYSYTEDEMTVDIHDGRAWSADDWGDTHMLYSFPLENGYMTGTYISRSFTHESIKEYWKRDLGIEPSDTFTLDIPENKRRKVL